MRLTVCTPITSLTKRKLRFALLMIVPLAMVAASGQQEAHFPSPAIERQYRAAEANAHNLVQTDPEKGIEARKWLLDWALQMFGPDHEETGIAEHNLGYAYDQVGRCEDAEPLYKKGLESAIRHHGYNDISVAKSFVALGACYADLGQYQMAEQATANAAEIYIRLKDPKGLMIIRQNQGVLYLREDKFQDAANILLEERDSLIRTNGDRNYYVANIEESLAAVYWHLGQFTKGEEMIRHAIRISQQLSGSPFKGYYSSLVLNLTGEGRYDEAWEAARGSLEWRESEFGPFSDSVAEAVGDLGILCAYRGSKCKNAPELMDRSCHLLRRSTLAVLSKLPESEQLSYMGTGQRTFQDALSLAVANPSDGALAARAAEWLLNGKAVLHEALAERTLLLRDSSEPRLRPIIEQLRSVRTRIATLIYTAPGNDKQQASEVQDLEGQEAVLSRQLGQAGGRQDRGSEWLSLDKLRAAVPADAVFVDIAKVSVRNYKAKAGPPDYHQRYITWIVPPVGRSRVQQFDLGDAQKIDSAVKNFQETVREMDDLLSRRGTSLPPEVERTQEQKFRAASSALTQLIVDPLLPAIGSVRNWIISPDSNLWAIPWSTLWMRDIRDGHYLIENHRTTYVVSGRDLVLTEAYVQTTPPIVMADPDYELGVTKAAQKTMSLLGSKSPNSVQPARRTLVSGDPVPRLEGTAQEVKLILPSLRTYTHAEPRVYLRDEALEGVFKAVHRPRVVYLATHGFFFPLHMNENTYRFGTNRMENPLLRCGLLLASCNRKERRQTVDDDGFLTGLEIVGTDLRGTEMAVLSACQTGLGDVWAGQSAAGLRQAFQLAGAKSVVATLWSIPDQESADLMGAFFGKLANNQPKGEALSDSEREALLARRKARGGTAHPYFWGAFTLTGQ
jgi:CHAT domain-containing protein/tetratricopeptide (TPR) repeat protein